TYIHKVFMVYFILRDDLVFVRGAVKIVVIN
ncbi:hypothetical protein C8R14_1601, partial [Nitrosomonas eutropha]